MTLATAQDQPTSKRSTSSALEPLPDALRRPSPSGAGSPRAAPLQILLLTVLAASGCSIALSKRSAQQTIAFRVTSKPPNTHVYHNGRYLGQTPLTAGLMRTAVTETRHATRYVAASLGALAGSVGLAYLSSRAISAATEPNWLVGYGRTPALITLGGMGIIASAALAALGIYLISEVQQRYDRVLPINLLLISPNGRRRSVSFYPSKDAPHLLYFDGKGLLSGVSAERAQRVDGIVR